MFFLRKPSNETFQRLLASSATFSYPEVGATRANAPSGYVVVHHRARLGAGEYVFQAAVDALRNWRMFDVGWIDLLPRGVPVRVGETVGLLVKHWGFWSFNTCRIVYALDESDAQPRFSFAYGTLEHAQKGEERFSVEWNRADDSVWYDLFSFSKPSQWMTWIGFPVVRLLQAKFAMDSARAMQDAVSAARLA